MGLRHECHVPVQAEQVVATISEHRLMMDRGSVANLTATTSPIESDVIWSSTNTDVASVDFNNGNAVVTAVTPGEAMIIATPVGSNVKPDTCLVTVNDVMIIVSLDSHNLSLKRTDTVYLNATTSPIESNVIWSSTNTDVALVRVVNGRAQVLGNLPGEALIIATAEEAYVQPDTCRVMVIRPLGDATADGFSDIDDLNAIINVMVGKAKPEEADLPFYDLTGDGSVDVDDMNIIINIMLGIAHTPRFTVNGVFPHAAASSLRHG